MTPEQEEQVRRALQAAAHSEAPAAMPPQVVARLDDVLADLTAPRRETPVRDDELAQRRRRRSPNVLVAAAAVALIALGGAAVATRGFGSLRSDSDSTGAESAASSQGPPSRHDTAKDTNSKGAGVGPSAKAPAAKPSGRLQGLTAEGARPAGLPRLRTATLAQDVQRALRQRSASRVVAGPLGCARPVTGRGDTLLAVRLDGRRATLLATPARGGRQVARVYSCDDGGTPVATVSVTAR